MNRGCSKLSINMSVRVGRSKLTISKRRPISPSSAGRSSTVVRCLLITINWLFQMSEQPKSGIFFFSGNTPLVIQKKNKPSRTKSSLWTSPPQSQRARSIHPMLRTNVQVGEFKNCPPHPNVKRCRYARATVSGSLRSGQIQIPLVPRSAMQTIRASLLSIIHLIGLQSALPLTPNIYSFKPHFR